jgi:predicted chitinase/murein DD-endopeptidase MepM/ murein hydrolase activator NlpD
MLISPPFLPPRQAAQTEDNWLAAAMICGQPGDGAFPVSYHLGWHGGVHLTAPVSGANTERVRAIADGIVVFARQPSPHTDDAQHPQNYRGWTDNGCVLLRHETAIGEGANAQDIVFFSLYMHLASVEQSIAAGRRIYRKAALGQAGQIYGETSRKIHFELLCDDANLAKLVGRTSGELDTSRDGRVDATYGAVYFLLTANFPVFSQQPVSHLAAAHFQPPGPNARAPQPPMVALTATHNTSAPLIVELRYAAGAGAAGNRGGLTVTTRQLSGSVVGQAQQEPEAEYGIYEQAGAISRAIHGANAPASATMYELLRFGRTVNRAHEAATPNLVPHWRKISYPGGEGWVDLNAQGIHKFSDADFPHWDGWSLIDDSSDGNSRCDSATIKGWLDANVDGNVTVSGATAAMADAQVARKLAKAICKFPSEWIASTIDTRWGWLMQESVENTPAMSAADFQELKAHITAFCFDVPVLTSATWHWHPLEFMRHFRQCGWLSLNELCQLLPRRSGSNAQQVSEIPWATATARFTPYYLHLNTTMRKYGMVSRVRQTHFLAQTYIETALWRTMEELGRAHQQRRRNGQLYWPAPAMQYYQAFYGRGAMQLTWAGNFDKYGTYRAFANVGAGHQYVDNRITRTSTHYWGDPRDSNGVVVRQPQVWWPRYDPHDIVSEPFYACDSAAFYWVSTNTGGGRLNIHRVADQGLTTDAVGRASVLVNGGGYGFSERQGYAVYIDRYLGDGVESDPTRTFVVSYRGRNHNVYVDFTAQRQR